MDSSRSSSSNFLSTPPSRSEMPVTSSGAGDRPESSLVTDPKGDSDSTGDTERARKNRRQGLDFLESLLGNNCERITLLKAYGAQSNDPLCLELEERKKHVESAWKDQSVVYLFDDAKITKYQELTYNTIAKHQSCLEKPKDPVKLFTQILCNEAHWENIRELGKAYDAEVQTNHLEAMKRTKATEPPPTKDSILPPTEDSSLQPPKDADKLLNDPSTQDAFNKFDAYFLEKLNSGDRSEEDNKSWPPQALSMEDIRQLKPGRFVTDRSYRQTLVPERLMSNVDSTIEQCYHPFGSGVSRSLDLTRPTHDQAATTQQPRSHPPRSGDTGDTYLDKKGKENSRMSTPAAHTDGGYVSGGDNRTQNGSDRLLQRPSGSRSAPQESISKASVWKSLCTRRTATVAAAAALGMAALLSRNGFGKTD